MVISLGLTEREEANRLLNQLRGEGVRVLGVVVNRAEPKGRAYYGYYYGGGGKWGLGILPRLGRKGDSSRT
ncbi:MAG: hypothetical protein C4315_05890 [Chloroflexota bacterium]